MKPQYQELAKTAKAIANAERLQIIDILLKGETNVSKINESIKISQPALSQHLAKLRHAHIVGTRRDARQIFYYINNTDVVRLVGLIKETHRKAA